MMDRDQIRAVIEVYSRFMESEVEGWSGLDDYMCYLDYLDDDQTIREAEAALSKLEGPITCDQPSSHKNGTRCLAPTVVDASAAIVELYKQTGALHARNRYILQYFLALCHAGQILVNKD